MKAVDHLISLMEADSGESSLKNKATSSKDDSGESYTCKECYTMYRDPLGPFYDKGFDVALPSPVEDPPETHSQIMTEELRRDQKALLYKPAPPQYGRRG